MRGNPLQHFELVDGWTNLGMFGFTDYKNPRLPHHQKFILHIQDYKSHLSQIASLCPLEGSYCIWETEIEKNFFL